MAKNKTSKKKQSSKKVKTPEKIAVIFSTYQQKITNQKKWSRTKSCNDGSLTRWGVSRNGRRFKEKIYSVKSKDEFKNVFEKNKSKKKNNENLTLRSYIYEGKFYKKSEFVTGQKSKYIIQVITKTKKEYSVNNVNEIINQVEILMGEYKIVVNGFKGIEP